MEPVDKVMDMFLAYLGEHQQTTQIIQMQLGRMVETLAAGLAVVKFLMR